MLRRTILLAFASAAALAVAVSAGGAPDRAAADPFIGTWTIKSAAGTPWASGGTVTIRESSRSEVKGIAPREGNNGLELQCIGWDPAIWPPGSGTDPVVSAWYVATFSWTSPKMGGCISNKTGGNISLFGSPRQFVGSVNAVQPNGTIRGCWSDNFGSGCKYFDSVVQDQGTTKTVSEPAPGKSTTIESPALPAGGVDCGGSPGRMLSSRSALACKTGEIDFYALGDGCVTTYRYGSLIVGEGGVEQLGAGEFVVWCWLFYGWKDKDGKVVEVNAHKQLLACVNIMLELVKDGLLGKPQPAARFAQHRTTAAASAGCRAKPIGLQVRKRGGKLVVTGRPSRAKLRSSSVRYACGLSGKTLKVRVTSSKELRSRLGKTLSLGFVHPKTTAKSRAKLSITFGWK